MSGGVTVRDVEAQKFVQEYAAHLKRSGKLAVPAWVDIVKTSVAKELAPLDHDWFYIRCASIARHIYLRPNVGVGALKMVYGGRKNNGTRPSHHASCSGSVARKALQALEKLNLIKTVAQDPNGNLKGGRTITPEGQRDLDSIATLVYKKSPALLFK